MKISTFPEGLNNTHHWKLITVQRARKISACLGVEEGWKPTNAKARISQTYPIKTLR
jgi:hypothetical protein